MIAARQDNLGHGDPLACVMIYAQVDPPPGGAGETGATSQPDESSTGESGSPWGSSDPAAYSDPPLGSGAGDPPPASDEDMPAW
jgi:hypothetical protein